jgi:hypothetical protein
MMAQSISLTNMPQYKRVKSYKNPHLGQAQISKSLNQINAKQKSSSTEQNSKKTMKYTNHAEML